MSQAFTLSIAVALWAQFDPGCIRCYSFFCLTLFPGDDLITDLENLHTNLSSCNFGESVFDQVQLACNGLKAYGAQLEAKLKGNSQLLATNNL